jgi:Fe2+ or Zn2+ uptake regulation protein
VIEKDTCAVLINYEPFSDDDHVDKEAVYLNLSFFFGDELVILFGGVDAKKTYQKCSEQNHIVISWNMVDVL